MRARALGLAVLMSLAFAGTAMAAASGLDLYKKSDRSASIKLCKKLASGRVDSACGSAVDSIAKAVAASNDACAETKPAKKQQACIKTAVTTAINAMNDTGDGLNKLKKPAELTALAKKYIEDSLKGGGASADLSKPAANATCSAAGCLPTAASLGIPVLSGGKDEIGSGIKSVIDILGFVAAVVSVVFIVVGGLTYTTSGGESAKLSGAKNMILYAVIGLIISLLAPVIVGFVIARGPK